MKEPKIKAVPVRIREVPAKELELYNVAKSISEKWEGHPSWQLDYITAAVFSEKVIAFGESIQSKSTLKAARPQISRQLALCQKAMDEGLVYVKGYLLERYGKASAKSYYAAFGIVSVYQKHILPFDREERAAALKLMTGSMEDAYFAEKIYGLAFWTEKQTTFDTLRKAAGVTAGEISSKTGIKNILKKEIKVVVNSFVYLIKANYPVSYRSELRNWGFQKEKY